MKKTLAALLALAAILCTIGTSCGKKDSNTPPPTDGVAETLDYGAAVGRAYNKSKANIQKANEQHNRELEKAMEE